jgi:BCD family chlorophyll transporter-like MFS transporter
VAIGGTVRDITNANALSGNLGEALASATTGYSVVYHLEIALLFATLVVLGPLVGSRRGTYNSEDNRKIGLADFPI